jgi:hypothetical protein
MPLQLGADPDGDAVVADIPKKPEHQHPWEWTCKEAQ